MKKTIIVTTSLILLVVLGVIGYQKYQTQKEIDEVNRKTLYFQNKLSDINESTPDEFTTIFLDKVVTMDVFKDYDSDMINRQISHFYKSDAEEKIDLCVEIVVYKIGKFKKDEPVQPQIQEYIDRIMVGGKDKIDLMLINTFQSAIESYQTSMEYMSKTESSYLRF